MFGYRDKDAVLLGYAFLIALPIWYLTTYLLSPLRRYPGPFLAGESTVLLNTCIDFGSTILYHIDLSCLRLDEPMAHVICSSGKVPCGHPRAA